MGLSTADTGTELEVPLGTGADANAHQPPVVKVEGEVQNQYAYDRDYRFWSIIVALCTMQILCSLENTVVVTSLPTIVKQLGLGSNYIWVTNIFFLAT